MFNPYLISLYAQTSLHKSLYMLSFLVVTFAFYTTWFVCVVYLQPVKKNMLRLGYWLLDSGWEAKVLFLKAESCLPFWSIQGAVLGLKGRRQKGRGSVGQKWSRRVGNQMLQNTWLQKKFILLVSDRSWMSEKVNTSLRTSNLKPG